MMLLWLGMAHAQVEVCTAQLRVDTWVEALDMVDHQLANKNVDLADRILDDVIDQLRCLESPAPPEALGRLARQVSVVAFYQVDHEEMASWTWLARDTVGAAPWPETLPVPERYHELAAQLVEPPMDTADGRRLQPPKRGGFVLDGRAIAEPQARSGVQHLLQVVDKKGRILEGHVQLGAAFPERWTEAGDGAIQVAGHLPQPATPTPWTDDAVAAAPEPQPEPAPQPEPDPAPVDPTEPVEPAPPNTLSKGHSISREDRPFSEVFPDCPWKAEPAKARVEGREVVVNRRRLPVGSRADVVATQKVFRTCGEFRAARRLGRWSDERRKLFASGTKYREAMLRVLVQPEPVRATSRRAQRP